MLPCMPCRSLALGPVIFAVFAPTPVWLRAMSYDDGEPERQVDMITVCILTEGNRAKSVSCNLAPRNRMNSACCYCLLFRDACFDRGFELVYAGGPSE